MEKKKNIKKKKTEMGDDKLALSICYDDNKNYDDHSCH